MAIVLYLYLNNVDLLPDTAIYFVIKGSITLALKILMDVTLL